MIINLFQISLWIFSCLIPSWQYLTDVIQCQRCYHGGSCFLFCLWNTVFKHDGYVSRIRKGFCFIEKNRIYAATSKSLQRLQNWSLSLQHWTFKLSIMVCIVFWKIVYRSIYSIIFQLIRIEIWVIKIKTHNKYINLLTIECQTCKSGNRGFIQKVSHIWASGYNLYKLGMPLLLLEVEKIDNFDFI